MPVCVDEKDITKAEKSDNAVLKAQLKLAVEVS